MAFNEDSRVKIPAILHLIRLGYSYLPLKNSEWDEATNIFPDLFRQSLHLINPDATPDEITRALQEIALLLEYEDLGKALHERLLRTDGIRLIDFDDFDNNTFNVVTELPCKNGDEEFRPDITLLLNGMPPTRTRTRPLRVKERALQALWFFIPSARDRNVAAP